MRETSKNPPGVFAEITAAVKFQLEAADIAKLEKNKSDLEKAAQPMVKPDQFVFFAAFDGTNNDKENLPRSGTRQKTNVAMLSEQANGVKNPNPNQKNAYYAGVGTGDSDDMFGGFDAASTNPSRYVVRTASWAYQQFIGLAEQWLKVDGNRVENIRAAVTGFSRGAGTAILFAKMLRDGLRPDGTPVLTSPTSVLEVPVVATLLFDPVFTGIYLDLRLPANMEKNVVVLKAMDELRCAFAAADFGDAPQIRTIEIRGNHGNIGGFYDNGIGARLLEGATTFFRQAGLTLGDVPAERRFVDQNVFIYNESWDRKYNNPKKWSECTNHGVRTTAKVDRSRYGHKLDY